MENPKLQMCPNRVVAFLRKEPREFTKDDIISFIQANDIRMVNFMYPGGDGKLKTLNFVINDLDYLSTILSCGERVDGSSLFDFIEAASSDLYVVPRYSTAFVDPFAEIPTLDLLCEFYDRNGKPLANSPEKTLKKAQQLLLEKTGIEFDAMGELEYYVIRPAEAVYPALDQHGYHESMPYAKTNDFRARCMDIVARCGGQIKYGHSEVGNFTLDGLTYEQNEIEFLPVPCLEAADQLLIAKWVIRNEAYREGLDVTFAPKITVGEAGSGLHIHMRLMKDGRSVMTRPDGSLTDEARRGIAGLMDLAPSITAFGNKNPTSYFRLVPHQEAPTNVCWGVSNRSALVRVPLGWTAGVNMSAEANPQDPLSGADLDISGKQTFEIRSGDGSADVYQFIASLCVAIRHGFEMPDALEVAERTFVDGNIHDERLSEKFSRLASLPDRCWASAECLEKQRTIYEEYGVFSKSMIDAIGRQLKSFGDRTLRAEIANDKEKVGQLVARFFQCG